MNKNIAGFIFARGGSKGVKNKNIRLAGGLPLLAHSIRAGRGSKYIGKIFVSTDSQAIAECAQEFGASVIMRPPELATDSAPEILSWRHAMDWVKSNAPEYFSDIFVSLPATAPLRTSADVDNAIERFQAGGFDILMGITPSHRNPYLNMVTIEPDQSIKLAVKGEPISRRQDAPEVYDITTCVYVGNARFIKQQDHLLSGRVGYVRIPQERALDIDTEFDLYLADLILSHPQK